MNKKDVQAEMPLVDVKYIDLNTAKTRGIKGEVLSDESITEQSGYIDPKRQIEDMIMAGRRLDEARKNQFDFPSEDEIDEDAYDPTRAGSFDLADASQMQFEAANRIKADRALKGSQTAQDRSQGDPGTMAGGNEPPPDKGA